MQVTANVQADGSAFKPQQAMLALKHKASGVAAYALGKARKDSTLTFTASASYIEQQIGKLVSKTQQESRTQQLLASFSYYSGFGSGSGLTAKREIGMELDAQENEEVRRAMGQCCANLTN